MKKEIKIFNYKTYRIIYMNNLKASNIFHKRGLVAWLQDVFK